MQADAATSGELIELPPDNPQNDDGNTIAIARNAGILALGNILSRVFALLRETITSHYFGAGLVVDAYNVSTFVPRMVYDLLIGGMVNGALVPVFSAYASEDRAEFWRMISALINLVVILLVIVVLVLELFAPQIAFLMLSAEVGERAQSLATQMLQITLPGVFFLSIASILSGILYALKRFALPAFTAVVFNAGVVVVAMLFHRQLDITAMAVGILVGSILQVVLQLPGMKGTALRIGTVFWHPGIRRVLELYAPSIAPLIVDMIARFITLRIASHTGAGGISYLNYATYLMQLPQGLVATAISLAVLPTLSAQAALETRNNTTVFKDTFVKGMKLVLVLILPASAGLFILAKPVVALIYQHGDLFYIHDTLMTAWALRFYLLGLPFAAMELLLVFTFYARQDTVTPSLIGVGAIVTHMLLGAGLVGSWGLFGLMLGDAFKHLFHSMLSWTIIRRRLEGFSQYRLGRTLGAILLATLVMSVIVYGCLWGLEYLWPDPGGLAELVFVLLPGILGGAAYTGMIIALGVEEVRELWDAFLRFWQGVPPVDPAQNA